ncbi:hypothetical protein B0H65DRAFT_455866, partial [Neurospora tetraspora]
MLPCYHDHSLSGVRLSPTPTQSNLIHALCFVFCALVCVLHNLGKYPTHSNSLCQHHLIYPPRFRLQHIDVLSCYFGLCVCVYAFVYLSGKSTGAQRQVG